MDQSISEALAQCADLYGQRVASLQQVVVPVSLEFHSDMRTGYDEDDIRDLTATGNLVYVPSHLITSHVQIPGSTGYIPIAGLVPDRLSATIQGNGDLSVSGDEAGGNVRFVPAIYVWIAGPLPFRGSTAAVAVQSSVRFFVCNFSSQVDDTALPIEFTIPNYGANTLTLHLGTAGIVDIPIIRNKIAPGV
jgi:hypothetical protein